VLGRSVRDRRSQPGHRAGRGTDVGPYRALPYSWTDQYTLAEARYRQSYSVVFYLRLARCAHKPAIDTMVESMRDVLLASLEVVHSGTADHRAQGLREHGLLIDAVEARDPERAIEVLREHLRRTVERSPEAAC